MIRRKRRRKLRHYHRFLLRRAPPRVPWAPNPTMVRQLLYLFLLLLGESIDIIESCQIYFCCPPNLSHLFES